MAPLRITHRLKNFKAFKDTGPINLAPITVLCGSNSSGKSSILKSLLLIKQSSIERRARLLRDAPLQPLLFNGEFTRLGSWTETVYNKKRESEICIEWTSEGTTQELLHEVDPRFQRTVNARRAMPFKYGLRVDFKSRPGGKEELSATLARSTLTSGSFEAVVQPTNPESIDEIFAIRLSSFKDFVQTSGQIGHNLSVFGISELASLLRSSGQPVFTGEVRIDLIGPFISGIRPVLNGSWLSFFEQVGSIITNSRKNVPGAKPRWHGHFELALREFRQRIGSANEEVVIGPKTYMLYGLVTSIIYELSVLNEHCRAALAPAWRKIRYLGPLRHQPQRFYQFDDTGGVDIGVSGEFTVQVLALEAEKHTRLTTIDRKDEEKIAFNEPTNVTLLQATNYWLSLMDLPSVEPYTLRQSLYELKVGRLEVALPDVGFGVSQVLPIIVECLRAEAGETVILEQPEIHLHPKVQAILADFFLARSRDGVKFLIESHSEYMVKRLCRRISEKSVTDADRQISIYFVSQDISDSAAKCDLVELNEFGEILNWPVGFFDLNEDLYWAKAAIEARPN